MDFDQSFNPDIRDNLYRSAIHGRIRYLLDDYISKFHVKQYTVLNTLKTKYGLSTCTVTRQWNCEGHTGPINTKVLLVLAHVFQCKISDILAVEQSDIDDVLTILNKKTTDSDCTELIYNYYAKNYHSPKDSTTFLKGVSRFSDPAYNGSYTVYYYEFGRTVNELNNFTLMIDSTNGTINISSFNKNEGDYTGALFIYYDVVFGIASSKNGDILQIAFPYTHFEQNTSLAFRRGIMLFRDHHFQPIIPKAEAFVIVSQSGITKADSMGMNIESIMKGILRSIENGSVKISKNMLPTIRTQLVDCGFNANEFIGYIIDSFSDSYYQFDEHDFLFNMEQWGIPYENSVQALAIIKANSLNAIFFRPSKNNVDYHLFFDQT